MERRKESCQNEASVCTEFRADYSRARGAAESENADLADRPCLVLRKQLIKELPTGPPEKTGHWIIPSKDWGCCCKQCGLSRSTRQGLS